MGPARPNRCSNGWTRGPARFASAPLAVSSLLGQPRCTERSRPRYGAARPFCSFPRRYRRAGVQENRLYRAARLFCPFAPATVVALTDLCPFSCSRSPAFPSLSPLSLFSGACAFSRGLQVTVRGAQSGELDFFVAAGRSLRGRGPSTAMTEDSRHIRGRRQVAMTLPRARLHNAPSWVTLLTGKPDLYGGGI